MVLRSLLVAFLAIVWFGIGSNVSRGAVPAVDTETTVAQWDFGTEESTALVSHGDVVRDQPGPLPPEFPDFDDSNTCVKFDGVTARFSLADPGPASKFDFVNGDAVTLEAWVKVVSIGEGQHACIVGKGRTGNKQFSADNQNWALRLSKNAGQVCLNFLFATPRKDNEVNAEAHWHRWTSKKGIGDLSRWHFVAVSYRFGEPNSIRGWIDGERVDGSWDMGGPTAEPPIVDDDEVWIGSAMIGKSSSCFKGWLDSVAIRRTLLDDEAMQRRFTRAKPLPEMRPALATFPGSVRVVFQDGLDSHQQWPEIYQMPASATKQVPNFVTPDWSTNQYLFPRLPRRYDDWGTRASWQAAVLVQAVSDVAFPAGKSRFMIRARGLSRLWVGDEVVVRTKPIDKTTDGHEPVDPLPEPPLPGMRIAGYRLHEAIGDLELSKPATLRVVFETIVGGQAMRAEPGEMMVAVQPPGAATFELLRPVSGEQSPREVTDSAILAAMAETEQQLQNFDDAVRRSKAATDNEFWRERHEVARQWASDHPSPEVPNDFANGEHPVDRFVTERISKAVSLQSGPSDAAAHFQQQVLPVLQKNCFRCHGDADEEGGLRLTSREKILAGGDSGEPGIVPGSPHLGLLLAKIAANDEDERMPPSAKLADGDIQILKEWIAAGADWPTSVDPNSILVSAIVDDSKFLRRAFLDVVGEPPTEAVVREFIADADAAKRAKLIDRLLDDSRWADHWVSYWQDVLAENPNLLKPSLSNTGPFRWFLYESLRDNQPLDRMVTELVMMRGSEREGGSAGFGLATDTDAPMATRGLILASAFLGTQLQCARCHDSPYHRTTQHDLFSLAAMMTRADVTVPPSSTVAPGFFEKNSGRESLIKVTLKPGKPVQPVWPFEEFVAGTLPMDGLVHDSHDSRERLAALITAPSNSRFAMVMVNRTWKRMIGSGIVEPVDDWEKGIASHPELLAWLANELVSHDYDTKHVVRLIMNSRLYQREAIGNNRTAEPSNRFFASPDRRRLTAEQVVDSLVAASGKPLAVDELSFDPEATRPATTMINLGVPTRGWMFATLSNERDRPSLAFPRVSAVTDLMEAFGWSGARQNAFTDRDVQPNVLQPGALGNGVFASWMTSASADSELARLAVEAKEPQSLVESIFLRFLSRTPSDQEASMFAEVLKDGFSSRVFSPGEVEPVVYPAMLGRVSWSNHLDPEANQIKLEMERRAREGDPADPRLQPQWRMKFEDVVWSVVNSPEFVWVP